MPALTVYIQEIRYRLYYVCGALLLAGCTAWYCRYTYMHLYTAEVTHTLHIMDVGEDVRIGVYLSVYVSLVWSLGYIYYMYTCYITPGRYAYEHTTYMWYSVLLYIYLLSVYVWSVWYMWPEIYRVFLGFPMGTQDIWGLYVDTMPRMQSVVHWSVWVPLLCTCMSVVPFYGVFFVRGMWLATYRRLWYIVLAVLASAVCPPHPWFQACVSMIFWFLYECTLMCVCIRQSVSKTSTT